MPGMMAQKRHLDDDSTLVPDARNQRYKLMYLGVPSMPEYENAYV